MLSAYFCVSITKQPFSLSGTIIFKYFCLACLLNVSILALFRNPPSIGISCFNTLKSQHHLSVLLLLILLGACQKERFTTSPEEVLSFSTDTLRFDTVFTELGSATRILKVYNPHSQSIRISKINLEKGSQSKFRLNVDGIPGNSHENVVIAPNDSLYIFAEVTINPDEPLSSSPFVLNESIEFETNGVAQSVILEAWGQNANYIPSRFYADSITLFGCNGGEVVWNDPKPYVIYGVVAFDDCTLRIPAGTRIYVHGGLTRFVNTTGEIGYYNDGILAFTGNGRLIVEGTKENPVVFEGDRIEPEFKEEPGQWTGIWLQAGTRNHQIEHCIIRNSIVGIRVDSAANLSIKNSRIYNTASSGLVGVHAEINAENCLFYDNTGFSIQLEYGGDYSFNYCTAASYGVDGEAVKLGNTICLDAACENYSLYRLNALFKNCILFGSRADQFSLVDREDNPANFNYRFENCIVRVKDLIKPNAWPDFLDHCQPCLNLDFRDTIFVNPNEDNYYLDTLHSKANGYGVPLPGILKDLDEQDRDPIRPDIGCYELQI